MFDLRLNGREFKSHSLLALSGSNSGQVTPTGLAGRSGLVLMYLTAGEKPLSMRLSHQLLWYHNRGHGLQHLSCRARSTESSAPSLHLRR